MNVLLACEESGNTREEFASRGHFACSCDLKPTSRPCSENAIHHQGDIFAFLEETLGMWDLMICHPECTYLAVSGLHWNKKDPARAKKTYDAVDFAKRLFNCGIEKVVMENPVGCLTSRFRAPDQYIQPYEFGSDASKKTGLWLKGLPLLKPTLRVSGRWVMWEGKMRERWANQTDSGQNREGPSPDRKKIRSVTYPGISKAMADQWGTL